VFPHNMKDFASSNECGPRFDQ